MAGSGGSEAPAIGICAAVERVSWGVWDSYEVTLVPRRYIGCVQKAGGLAILLPPDEVAVEIPTSSSTGSMR
jgi:putative glutamine amidotransferase